MLALVGFLLIAVLARVVGLPEWAAQISRPFHEACLGLVSDSDFRVLTQAMVCGSSVSRSPVREVWSKTGLLHLLVVSGSHLICLEIGVHALTKRLGRRGTLVLSFVLVAFVFANRWQAPIARALFSYALKNASSQFHLHWSAVHALTLAGVLACGLSLDDHATLSLFLSWIAALAVSGFNDPEDSLLRSQTRIYLLLAPALMPLSLPHPLSILCNIVFAPLLGGLLFPAALLTLVIPPLHGVLDLGWSACITALSKIAALMPTGLARTPLSAPILGLYLICLTLAAYSSARRKPRA